MKKEFHESDVRRRVCGDMEENKMAFLCENMGKVGSTKKLVTSIHKLQKF